MCQLLVHLLPKSNDKEQLFYLLSKKSKKQWYITIKCHRKERALGGEGGRSEWGGKGGGKRWRRK